MKKRDSVVGGSSRENYVTSIHGIEGFCFTLPIIGSVLRQCTGRDLGHKVKRGKDLFGEGQGTEETKSTNKKKDLYYALKMIHLDKATDPTLVAELHNEIAILKTVDHPNVIRPIETFHYEDPYELGTTSTCIIMELCEGGDLYTRDPYTERDAKRIVTSVLSAIEYMHSLNIMHRDLKFEVNICYVLWVVPLSEQRIALT